jgi:hypothetical protein
VVLVSCPRALARLAGAVVGVVVLSWTLAGIAGAASLPDGRGWELVSPSEKLGGEVIAASSRSQASAGESPSMPAGLVFSSLVGFGDVQGGGIATQYMAERTGEPGTSGWVTHGITPRQEPLSLFASAFNLEPGYMAFGDDLGTGIFRSWTLLSDAPNVENVPNLYLRDDLRTPGDGSYRLLTDAPTPLPAPFPGGVRFPWVAGYTADMRHAIVFESTQNLTPDASGSQLNVYKVDDGVTRLLVSGAVAGVGASNQVYTPRVLSTDGSRVIVAKDRRVLQFDDQGTVSRSDDAAVQVDTSEKSAPDPTQPAHYEIASEEGSRIFISTDEQLTDRPVPSLGRTVAGTYLWERQPTDEQQQLDLSATGGTYTLTFHTQLTNGTGTLTNGSDVINDIAGSFLAGQTITAPGIPAGTTIITDGGGFLVLSQNATADGPVTLRASTESTTGQLPANASASQIQTALEQLTGIGTGNVHVTDTSPGSHTITFTDALAGVNVAELTAETSRLTGGSATITETTRVRNITPIGAPGTVAPFGVIGASVDGHHLYFINDSRLVGGQPGGLAGIYYWQDADGTPGGTLSIVGGVRPGDMPVVTNPNWKNTPKISRVARDGHALIFEATDASNLAARYVGLPCPASIVNPNDNSNSGCSQVFVYRSDSSTPTTPDLVCASCPLRGSLPVDNAYINIRRGASATFSTNRLNRALSDDGRFVFFSSKEALVPEDTNGKFDAYEYDTATRSVHLLSDGKDTGDTFLLDASADGHDAYFVTRAHLTGWDFDNAYDVYDARIGGGLPNPVPTPRECAGDACQGQPTGAPAAAPLGSSDFNGLGNEPTTRPARHPARRCKRGTTKRRVRGKTRCARRKRPHKHTKHRHQPNDRRTR